MLDPYGLASAMGASAALNTIMPVQVIESNAFVNLGTVITPLSKARTGTPILKAQVELPTGEESVFEIPRAEAEEQLAEEFEFEAEDGDQGSGIGDQVS